MILSNTNKNLYKSKLASFLKIFKQIPSLKQSNKKSLIKVKSKINDTQLHFKKYPFKKNINQNIVRYVINIISFPSNTIVNVTDVNGKVLVNVSEGLINLAKDAKQSKPIQVVKLLKNLLVKANFIKNKAISINFKNVKRYQESFFINSLKNKVFIKSIQSNRLIPHNGCRPKKVRKIKLRTKRLVLK